MSIKKLFDSINENRNYLADSNEKELFESVESARNVRAIKERQQTFVPHVDYSDPANFVKYGSAHLYYQGAIQRIYDYYPYDGSDAEINEFYNNLLDIEKYIFDNLYPRTNGYAQLAVGGWGVRTSIDTGYGVSSLPEYITFFGGPNTASYTSLSETFPTDYNSKHEYSNIYDTDIYETAGLPPGYGSGSRESNLKTDFDNGITIEFWLDKDGFTPVKTAKEVVFDMWNNAASGTADYGRVRVELTASAIGSPFRITAQSGTSGFVRQPIGNDLTTASLGTFGHYAVSFYNSGSTLVTKLHVNGALNDTNVVPYTLGELNSKNMTGRIGALLTASAESVGPVGSATAGKLSGSLDEFRFWKVARNSEQIARYWNTNVWGGTNTDISNTTLGVYYKFNEGITERASVDSKVLDYSGRISNGSWTGYTANSRNTNSAIVIAGAATTEYKDPIIYSFNPLVSDFETSMLEKGENFDLRNNSALVNLVPSWVLEEEEAFNTDTRLLSHILGTYFDKLYLQIAAVSRLKGPSFTSSSYAPYPFAEHMPQSMGLYTPELFVDASVMEKFLNRDQTTFFESDLTEAKNLIYLNLYNNLTGIFKAKGTEKAIKNVFRCFNIDDRLVSLKTYSNQQVYELQDNLKQILQKNTFVNFSNNSNLNGVVYQQRDSTNVDSLGYISGSGLSGYEDLYGFTTEADIRFPNYSTTHDTVRRNFISASLFGMHSIDTGSVDDTTWLSNDEANFQVWAIRDARGSKNVHFRLSSSNNPYPFPELTSSIYFETYDNSDWNLSVRLKPSIYPMAEIVSGAHIYDYDLEFCGFNTNAGTVVNEFKVSASVPQATAQSFLRSSKRIYAGARRTNYTGSVLQETDVLLSSVRHWTKYIHDGALKQHAFNQNNAGLSASYENVSALDPRTTNTDVVNANTLALKWTFDNITASNASGDFFYVTDFSSGSALLRDNYGWIGKVAGSQHTGYGYGFQDSATEIVKEELVNVFKFTDPEIPISSMMVNVLTNDDTVFGFSQLVPSFFNVVEKSMYQVISEEMLEFFAGVVDFNNVIGNPVNRYRARYKTLEKLRETFFRRVTKTASIEKFIDYYKWFDDALAVIISQLLPASADFVEDVWNTLESHVLERNKYQTKFPTIEFKAQEPNIPIMGINELAYNYRLHRAPLSNLQSENAPWWRTRAIRTANPVISAGTSSADAAVNIQREVYRKTIGLVDNHSGSAISTVLGSIYAAPTDIIRTEALPYRFEVQRSPGAAIYAGGVNFQDNKSIAYTYNALSPAGPVTTEDGVFVPQNVLLAFTDDKVEDQDISDVTNPNLKKKKRFKLQHGRDWDGGLGYSTVKSTFGLPFNVIESTDAPTTGYNKEVVEKVSGNLLITNLHNDVYGPDMERPMQGPFTDYAVGGHQSRHVRVNYSSPINNRDLDTWQTRPEAWKIVLGTCESVNPSGALGMVGSDYPWPEANEEGVSPYPLTASQKAVYYRDMIAKRPVNIRNIVMRTGSTILGNYRNKYEVVNSVGAYSNPRGFVDNPPTLPQQLSENTKTTQNRTFLDIRRTDDGHTQLVPNFSIAYITQSQNKSIIRNKFSAPGGIDTMGMGYGDLRADEYSVYNALNYRNLSVLRPTQISIGTIPEATGMSGTTGIRVSDSLGLDYGLKVNLQRHPGKFGRSSLVFPDDNNRPTYDLNADFMGYSETKIYRSSANLQGWWRLNNDLGIWGTDSSLKDRDGVFPTPSDRPSDSGTGPSRYVQTASATWDGSADRMNIGTAATWDAIIGNDTGGGSTEKMTFSAWVYKTGDGGGFFGRIIDFGDSDISFFTTSTEEVQFCAVWGGGFNKVFWTTPAAAFSLNTWTHLAVTYDATNYQNDPEIYVNGVAQTITIDSGTKAPIYYGIISDAGFVANRFSADRGWAGQLVDVAAWNSILTADEIQAIYNASKLPENVGPGASYDQAPAFIKVPRNARHKSAITNVELTPQYSGSSLSNTSSINFPNTDGACIIMTGSDGWTAGKDLFQAASSSGITFTGWYYAADDSTLRQIMWLGRTQGNSFPMWGIYRTYTSGENRLYLNIATQDAPTAGSEALASWYITGATAEEWNHIAVTWSGSNGSLATTSPTMYLNGVSQSVTINTTPEAYYQDSWRTPTDFKNFNNVVYTGDDILVFGSTYANTGRPWSGSLDEMTLWKKPLDATEIAEIYNGGVPCDVTASSTYTNNSSHLFDWIRMAHNGDVIDSTNPGILSDTNIIRGHIYNDSIAYMPVALTGNTNELSINTSNPTPLDGCTPTLTGWSEVTTYGLTKQYDNFYVQHQTPRADRQYAWITGSIENSQDLRYYGYAPLYGTTAGMYSSSVGGWTSYFPFVTASEVALSAAIHQPTMRFNMFVIDPVNWTEIGGNTMGRIPPHSTDEIYLNDTILDNYGISLDVSDVTNLVLSSRAATFGFRNAPEMGPAINPILKNEKKLNVISVLEPDNSTVSRYVFKPVCTRAQPVYLNIDVSGSNTTIACSYNNEKIYFSDETLNQRYIYGQGIKSAPTAFDQIAALAVTNASYTLNWVLYSETLFPSRLRTHTSGATERPLYDNLYWRSSQEERESLWWSEINTNTFDTSVSQSSWPLDAPIGFMTRSAEDVSCISGPSPFTKLQFSNSAGALQNEYFHVVKGTSTGIPWNPTPGSYPDTTLVQRIRNIVAGPLYSRKHMLPTVDSVASPSGIPIPEIGASDLPRANYSSSLRDVVEIYSGEAMWDAPSTAGIVVKKATGVGLPTFISHSSAPWYDSYDDFNEDLKLVAKDYSVVSEFRISEHVEDYVRLGINAANKFDTFEMVGTPVDSSNSGFYDDYSNSEFMSQFLKINQKTLLNATEIKLVCSAAIRLNPYKGFYPAQRTIDLVRQLSSSYGDNFLSTDANGNASSYADGGIRPLAQALFAPGILYNTIKSGLAVDYPIVLDESKFIRRPIGGGDGPGAIDDNYIDITNKWVMTTANTGSQTGSGEYTGGPYWDYRIPFEAIVNPSEYLQGITFYDFEPHPSASLNVTASWVQGVDDGIYSLMASNFFGEVGSFFLTNGGYSRLESGLVTDDLEFSGNVSFGARLKLRRSVHGQRTYSSESGSTRNNIPYGLFGARAWDSTREQYIDAEFPIPQDPRQAANLNESFTMYSRPTAFGPAIAGRPWGSASAETLAIETTPADSLAGFNWAYTPPYYNGEAWVDFIFSPSAGTTYNLEKILSETEVVYWRADPGRSGSGDVGALGGTQLLPTFSGNFNQFPNVGNLIYDGKNVNHNAMQVSASINLFGVERVEKEQLDQFGNRLLTENQTVAMKWVIQPKMETPMANFSNKGAHPITDANDTLSIPLYASGTVPRGMWHQFGVIPSNPDVGIFMEIGEIPRNWLQFHYDVVDNDSAYNKFDAATKGKNTYKTMKRLTDVLKFGERSSVRLGEIAQQRTIREAIVAVPYTQENIVNANTQEVQQTKKFFGIDPNKVAASRMSEVGSQAGDSLEIAGASIRKLVQKMDRYVLPPQFDFLNNPTVEPMVMYMFEFEYKFDKDDLNYIWQNLAPRNHQKITLTSETIAHNLGDNELLTAEDMINPNLRWMVFKVKQRSTSRYEDLITSQAGEGSSPSPTFWPETSTVRAHRNSGMVTRSGQVEADESTDSSGGGYPIGFNWPYDYVSFVEMVKFEAQALYRQEAPESQSELPPEVASAVEVDPTFDTSASPVDVAEMYESPVASPELFNVATELGAPMVYTESEATSGIAETQFEVVGGRNLSADAAGELFGSSTVTPSKKGY